MRAWRAWRGGAPKWRLFTGRELSGCPGRSPAFCSRRFSVGVAVEQKNEEFSSLCELVKSTPDSFQAIKEWTSQGNQLSPQLLSELSSWMSSKKKFAQTLKLLAGVREERLTEITVEHYALEIRLSCRQSGCPRAEALYTSLPEDMKANDRVKASLIMGLAKARAAPKLERWMKTLSVVDVEAWNWVLELYLHRDKHDKLLAAYRKMKATGVKLNVESYWTFLRLKDRVGGLEGIEKDAEECLDKFDTRSAPMRSLKRLLEGYGYLNKPEAVEKVWNVVKSQLEEQDERLYGSAIRAFGLSGDLSRAEKVLEEFVGSNSSSSSESEHPYVVMIEVYARLGMIDKAEEMLKKRIKREAKDSNFLPYDHIIQAYVAKGEASVAVEKYLEGVNERCKLQYKTVEGLLRIFESKKDVKAAEKMVHQHYFDSHGDTKLYNQLLKVYVAAGMVPKEFLKRMQIGLVDADEETERLLITLSSPAKTVEDTECVAG